MGECSREAERLEDQSREAVDGVSDYRVTLNVRDVRQTALNVADGSIDLFAALARKLSIDTGRIVMNVDRLGNTSGASTFLALAQAHREGRIAGGFRLLILAFGAGFPWGAVLASAVEV